MRKQLTLTQWILPEKKRSYTSSYLPIINMRRWDTMTTQGRKRWLSTNAATLNVEKFSRSHGIYLTMSACTRVSSPTFANGEGKGLPRKGIWRNTQGNTSTPTWWTARGSAEDFAEKDIPNAITSKWVTIYTCFYIIDKSVFIHKFVISKFILIVYMQVTCYRFSKLIKINILLKLNS